jgi:TrkA domain protein
MVAMRFPACSGLEPPVIIRFCLSSTCFRPSAYGSAAAPARIDAMDVKEVLLPGVGLRYEFTDHKGDRIGIIARRSGDFDVVVYAREDPDQARPVLCLTDEEAEAVAQILGAPRIAERFTELAQVPGLETGQVHVPADSPFVDHPLGDTRARTRTGASIVAIVRSEEVLASPGPTDLLHARDVLIVIGTAEGIAGVVHIFDQG